MTSETPAQPPAAPETDVRLTEAEVESHVCCLKKRLCTDDHFHQRDVERIVAERVRVVEGERDEWKSRASAAVARAESAEAAHEAEKAALIALADTWERDNEDHLNRFGQHLMGGAVLSCAEHLRSLLGGGEAR